MNRIHIIANLFLTVLLLAVFNNALGEERVALVVGNGAYTAVNELNNPVPDAALIADKLKGLGFKVSLITDSSLVDFKKGISKFGRQLRASGKDATGLFYYAGHGVQSFGSNYLLPVDTVLTDAADLDLVALEASSILRQMFSAKNKTNIVILDACRNNPFENIPDFGDNGLAEMKAPTGTFLAYATSPGNVALDGVGGNSPFTSALAEEIATPGTPIEQIFKQVRVRVLKQTDGLQTPWDTSSLTGEFYFKQPIVVSDAELAEQRMWESARISGDMLQIMLFLRTHPGGKFENEARKLLSQKVAEMDIAADDNNSVKRSTNEASPAPAPAPAELKQGEQSLINKAQISGSLADYEAYVSTYPNGIFIELARSEIDSLRKKEQAKIDNKVEQSSNAETAMTQATEATEVDQAETAAAVATDNTLSFESLLAEGSDAIKGRSIADLVKGSPLFAPIEGLPESYWADQTCDNCHQWSKDALCTQAQVYTAESGTKSLAKQHPYGGTFKQNLKNWALGGCQ